MVPLTIFALNCSERKEGKIASKCLHFAFWASGIHCNTHFHVLVCWSRHPCQFCISFDRFSSLLRAIFSFFFTWLVFFFSLYRMSDMVNFTLLVARYFCITVDILDLCSGTLLGCWTQFDSFRLRFYNLLGVCSSQSRDNYSRHPQPWLRPCPSDYSTHRLWLSRLLLGLVETGTHPAPVWAPGTVTFHCFGWFFSRPQIAFSYTCAVRQSAEDPGRVLSTSVAISLFSSLLSGNSQHLELPRKDLLGSLGSSSLCRAWEVSESSDLKQLQSSPHLFPLSQGSLSVV